MKNARDLRFRLGNFARDLTRSLLSLVAARIALPLLGLSKVRFLKNPRDRYGSKVRLELGDSNRPGADSGNSRITA